jgi:hypothetical protein
MMIFYGGERHENRFKKKRGVGTMRKTKRRKRTLFSPNKKAVGASLCHRGIEGHVSKQV